MAPLSGQRRFRMATMLRACYWLRGGFRNGFRGVAPKIGGAVLSKLGGRMVRLGGLAKVGSRPRGDSRF